MSEPLFSGLAGYLRLDLPLPPPDNHCHRTGPYGRYPTATYADWLRISAPMLRAVLGEWEPDAERWWRVTLLLDLPAGNRTDGANYIKPCLDLLKGNWCEEKARKVQEGHGLVDDDHRLNGEWIVRSVRGPMGGVTLEAQRLPQDAEPLDHIAEREAAKREAAEVRRANRGALAAAKAAEKAERAAARAAKKGVR